MADWEELKDLWETCASADEVLTPSQSLRAERLATALETFFPRRRTRFVVKTQNAPLLEQVGGDDTPLNGRTDGNTAAPPGTEALSPTPKIDAKSVSGTADGDSVCDDDARPPSLGPKNRASKWFGRRMLP